MYRDRLKKAKAKVCKMEIKLQKDELAMKHKAQRNGDRIWLEREKSEMSIRQWQAKQSASIASNDAKSSRHVQEAKEKAEATAKRRKATWFGSNMVGCHVVIMKFLFF